MLASPSDKFIQDLYVFLHVVDIGRLFAVEDGKGGDWGAVVDVGAPGLDEAADEEDFEEGICIFEEFECAARLDEFCSE